ncbi:hypothetical protein [Bacillus sp. T33-2]|uniref:hypothetical protein n=1 Tax=Bacillus sp. T33-2 TaxID=2054168 RepID=UPI000C78ADA5|nr:hypothetical protein [Bacillus sp. T33-2]PLR95919.1 hypothetical protein CVD19_12915 [Bacillus sp. T33-2]
MEVRSLQFDCLFVYRRHGLKEKWQEGLYYLEDLELNQEVYKNGPVFFSFKSDQNDPERGEFTYYLPINGPVVVKEDADFEYVDSLHIEKALVLRQADQEANFTAAHEKMRIFASKEGIPLDQTYYCVMLDVYGEIIIDLYIPMLERRDAS